jgi:hypothetical protein
MLDSHNFGFPLVFKMLDSHNFGFPLVLRVTVFNPHPFGRKKEISTYPKKQEEGFLIQI